MASPAQEVIARQQAQQTSRQENNNASSRPEAQPHANVYHREKAVSTLKNKEYHLNQETVVTLSDTLSRQYKYFKDVLSQVPPPVHVDRRFKDFVRDFEEGGSFDSDESIKNRAEAYLKRDDRMLFAMSLAERELASYQVAAAGDVVQIENPEEMSHIATLVHVDDTTQGEMEATDLKNSRFTFLPDRFIGRLPRKTQERIKKIKLYREKQKREVTESKKNRANEYQIAFKDQITGSPDVGIKITRHDSSGNPLLTALQQDFLKKQFRRTEDEFTLNVNEQKNLEERMIKIINARLDIYRKTDYPPEKLKEIGFIDVSSATGGGVSVNYKNIQSPVHFLYERETIFSSATPLASEYLERRIKKASDKVKEKTKVDLAEVKKKADEEKVKGKRTGTVAEIDRQVTELTKPEKTEAEIKQEKEDLDKKIKDNTDKKQKAEKLVNLDKQITERDEERKKLNGEVDPQVRSDIEDKRKELKANREKARQSERKRKAAERDLNTLYRVIQTDAAGNRSEGINLPDQAAKDLARDLNKYAFEVEDSNDQAERFENEIKDLEGKLNPAHTAQENHQNLQRLETLESEIKTLQGTKTAYEAQVQADLITNTGGTPQDAEYFAKEVETLEKKKADVGKSSEWRQQRKETLEVFKTVLTDYDNVQNRALDAQRGKLELDIPVMYENYPPVVLQVYQVMFGPNVLRADQRDLFKQAMVLLPPDRILSIIGADLHNYLSSLTPPQGLPHLPLFEEAVYDSALRSLDLLRAVNPTTINKILNQFDKEARLGKLGEVDPTHIQDIDRMRSASPSTTLSILPATVDLYINNIYHFKDEADLGVQIRIYEDTRGNWINREEAKALAIAVLNEKRKRLLAV